MTALCSLLLLLIISPAAWNLANAHATTSTVRCTARTRAPQSPSGTSRSRCHTQSDTSRESETGERMTWKKGGLPEAATGLTLHRSASRGWYVTAGAVGEQ